MAFKPIWNIPDSGTKKLKVLCIGAHPGDPEFGCGGTMARLADAGHEVTFLYLTRGEAGDPKKSYAEMARLRSREAELACNALKVRLRFFGQVDGNTILSRSENDKMAEMIRGFYPDLVFTQWPVDGHQDHQVTGLLALTSWMRADRSFELFFYEVNTGSETMNFVPTDYVDITDIRDRKRQAMFAHGSQDPVKTYDDFFRPLEQFRGLEAGVKAAEAFLRFKPREERARIPGL